jgi:glucose-1-phosphatase
MKADLTNIRNIVFDLGKVLLNLDFHASTEAFRKLGWTSEDVTGQQAGAHPVFHALETGRITPDEFRTRLRHILNNPDATDKQIDDAWCAMLLDIPPDRVDLLKRLRKQYKLYLFSNTNAIHIHRLHKTFRETYGIAFPSLFERPFYSHEIHARKPDAQAYHKVIVLSGIHPEESLFIDDIRENTEGASNAGMQTYWLKNGMEVTDLF